MDPVKSSHYYLRLLIEAGKAERMWRGWMNRVIEGELRLSPSEAEHYKQLNAAILQHLRALSHGLVEVKSMAVEIPDGWGEMPDGIRRQYQLIYERAYGSRALRLGDDIGKAAAKPLRGRLSSNKDEYRGGAKPGRSYKAGTKNIVVDHQAWEFKRTVDRRLRQVAKDMAYFLAGGRDGEMTGVPPTCGACGKIGESGWKYCPRCGKEITRASRTL